MFKKFIQSCPKPVEGKAAGDLPRGAYSRTCTRQMADLPAHLRVVAASARKRKAAFSLRSHFGEVGSA